MNEENRELREALLSYREIPDEGNRKLVLAGLLEYLHHDKVLYIPVTGRRLPGGREQILTDKLINEDGEAFFTAFTDKAAAARDRNCKRVLNLSLVRIFNNVLKDEKVSGLILNPYSPEQCTLLKETIQLLIEAEKQWQ
ncbi:MAG: SseB family protein [Oribacterium sp.]|nr:SseB family protein [Oribacterium sp.]